MSTGTTFAADYLPNPNISSQLGVTTAGLSTPQNQAIDLTSSQVGPATSIFNASIPELMNTIQGNFPGLNTTTGDMSTSLFNALWQAAQPGLQQGQQAINSMATGYGQAAASSPAQTETSNLYQGTLESVLGNVQNAAVQQYNTDLGLQNQAMQLGMQMPGVVSGQLMQTGGMEQGVAQNALNALYNLYSQQMGLSQQDISNMLGIATQGTQLGYGTATQYGPSGLESILGSVASLIPGLGTASNLVSALTRLFSGGTGSSTYGGMPITYNTLNTGGIA